MKKKVLITGSSGMLGGDLRTEISGKYEVWGIDIVRSSKYGVRNIKCDITDKKSVGRAVRKIEPDVVVHAAAWTDVDGCELDPKRAYRINSEGARNVALACKETGAALIYISTDFVFNGKKKRAYRESDKTGPLSVYGKSKLKGEEAVKKALRRYFILRTSWLYGKNGKNFVDTIIAKAKAQDCLRIVDDQAGSPTFTRDLAKAINALLKMFFTQYAICDAHYGTYHISNSGKVSWFDYAKEILKLVGSKAKVDPISSKELGRPAKRPAMSVLDSSKLGKLTGFKMRPWKTALKEYLKG